MQDSPFSPSSPVQGQALSATLASSGDPAKTPHRGGIEEEARELYLRAKLLAGGGVRGIGSPVHKAVELDPADGQLRLEFAEERDLGVFSGRVRPARPWSSGRTPITPHAQGILLASARDRAGVEAASAELKSANDAQPLEPSGAIAYAQTLLRLERPTDAVPVLEKILDKGRGSAVILMYGEALQKSGKLAEAQEVYESIRDREPENRAAAVELLGLREVAPAGPGDPHPRGVREIPARQHQRKTEYAVMLLRVRASPTPRASSKRC
jgi:tetratricopeptide (TPR) repeat protein